MANEIELRTIGKPLIALERPDGTCLRLELTDYALLLREAKRNGWEPEGFSMDPVPWDNRVLAGSGYLQPYEIGCVTDNDAKNLAQALKKNG